MFDLFIWFLSNQLTQKYAGWYHFLDRFKTFFLQLYEGQFVGLKRDENVSQFYLYWTTLNFLQTLWDKMFLNFIYLQLGKVAGWK